MRFKDISIEKIDLDTSYTCRMRKVSDTSELAQSMKLLGLLQPIVVARHGSRFRVIIGQRRFLAAKGLRWKKISALVLERCTAQKSKVYSLNENYFRKGLNDLDLIDTLTEIYRETNSVERTAEITGLGHDAIREYVKFERLPSRLKEIVREGSVSVNDALLAVDTLGLDGGSRKSLDKAVELALEMGTMAKGEKNLLCEIIKSHPGESIESARKRLMSERVRYVVKVSNQEQSNHQGSPSERLDQRLDYYQ